MSVPNPEEYALLAEDIIFVMPSLETVLRQGLSPGSRSFIAAMTIEQVNDAQTAMGLLNIYPNTLVDADGSASTDSCLRRVSDYGVVRIEDGAYVFKPQGQSAEMRVAITVMVDEFDAFRDAMRYLETRPTGPQPTP